MEDLFKKPSEQGNVGDMPLAARIRPVDLSDYMGQEHLLAQGTLLRRVLDADCFTSIILTGPPGTGKTTLAEIIARNSACHFETVSAVSGTVADVRRVIAEAKERKNFTAKKTVLFVDELHRFSKSQQDSLLKDVEAGSIRFIGATTHNPQFYIIPPLVSRSHVFHLQQLDEEAIARLLARALEHPLAFPDREVVLDADAARFLAQACEGDGRRSLGALELAVQTTPATDKGVIHITLAVAEDCIQQKNIAYDDDAHYDTISAFIKSMRGSDPDAAVYWLAKMLHAGEDIRFIARRLMIFASEDVGNADPRALTLCVSASQAVEIVGMPEARIILSQAATYCATAPKSNASYKAINEALVDVKENRVQAVPMYLRDSHSTGKDKSGEGYVYPHNDKESLGRQDYMGCDADYYRPDGRGYEKNIKERMDYWQQLRRGDQ